MNANVVGMLMAPKRPKMGRPKLPDDERLDYTLPMRITKREAQAIDKFRRTRKLPTAQRAVREAIQEYLSAHGFYDTDEK
jgi:hypothetical protein